MFSFFRQSFRQWARSGTRPRARTRPTRLLRCETLEERTLPSVSGSEVLVNTAKTLVQKQPAVAYSSNGSSVVVWTEQRDRIDSDVKAQRFDRYGRKYGGEILVAGGRSPQSDPAVALDAYGNFAVAWTHHFSTSDRDVHAALFRPTGARIGPEIVVAGTYKSEYDPSIARASNGDFVVSYTHRFGTTDTDVQAKLYSATGTLRRTLAVAATTKAEGRSAAAMAPDGRFAVAFASQNNVYLNRYARDGRLLGSHGVATGTRVQSEASVAMDRYGNAVVAFQEYTGTNWNVLARAVTSTGSLGAFRTVQATSANETRATVGIDTSTGRFAVSYQTQTGTTGTPAVKVTELSAAGVVVRTSTVGTGLADPAVAVNSLHKFMVVASSPRARGADPDGGIFARFGFL